uniref:DH domain-containing protein n=1 Tax=Ciona savignyi TaxID=51511 RepID=H2Y6I4_CIOSA
MPVRTKGDKLTTSVEQLSISSRPTSYSSGYSTLSSSSGSITSSDYRPIQQFHGSTSRQNKIMTEILQTERIYVKDLEDCITHYMGEMNDPMLPLHLRGQQDIIFGNIVELHRFHSEIFLKELEKFEQLPGDLGHCFVTWAHQFNLYVTYCQNKPTSNQLLMDHGGDFFAGVQARKQLPDSISSYLIKPVQRITKYQLLLKDLASCCKSEINEIKDGLDVMMSVPRRANDALHLSMMQGFDGDVGHLGDVIMQESFQVVDTKQLIRKGRDRHLFLFEFHLLICKESKDNLGKMKYFYKSKYQLCDLTVADNGDEKFAIVWGSRSDNKITLKSSSPEIKQDWLKKLSEVIQESASVNKNIMQPKLYPTTKRQNSSGNTLDDDRWSVNSVADNISIASKSSYNEYSVGDYVRLVEDYSGPQFSATRRQIVQIVAFRDDYLLVQTHEGDKEGLIPTSCVAPLSVPNSEHEHGNGETPRSKTFASTATLPSEKRSGFRKWLTSGTRKKITSGSATVYKISTHEENEVVQPSPKNVKKVGPKPHDVSPIKPSSVKHLVTDDNDDDIPLPPPMDIVGVKLGLEGASKSSSINSLNPTDKADPETSLSNDLRLEMEVILSEKFSKSQPIKIPD